MNLTNERLKEIAESCPRLGLTETEWRSIAAELLRWRETRAMRDVGDEEIRELNHNLLKRRCPSVWVCRLRDIAIARGQARIDAVNKAAEWAKESEALQKQLQSKLEHKSQQVDSQVALVSEMQTEIDAIVEENKQLKKRVEAALKAPGVEEIDALENEYLFTLKTLRHLGSLADRFSLRDIAVKLATLARQAIDSREMEKKRADEWQEKYEDENSERLIVEKERDEVVGLLKWLFRNQEERHRLEWAILSDESRRILEIVEGK